MCVHLASNGFKKNRYKNKYKRSHCPAPVRMSTKATKAVLGEI